MKKNFLRLSAFLFLGLSLAATTLTSCSNDDSGVYNIAIDKGTVTSFTFEEVVIDPQIHIQGAVYTWFDHATNQVLSNEAILKHTFHTPGEHKLSLKVEHNNKEQLYVYLVKVNQSVDYSYVTLDLNNWNLADGIETTGGKIWKDTFTEDAVLQADVFTLNHFAIPEWKTWMGFTVSNSTDNTNQINTAEGWIPNQWGSMAQGGVDGKGTPFLVSFADHKPHASMLQPGEEIEIENFSAVVTLDDANRYQAVSTTVAISPWAYYGILNGDDYARKFTTGDYFVLHVYGVGEDRKLTTTKPVSHYFVDFRNGVNTISTAWNKVDLSALGEVKYLLFFLETTDVSAQGYANTALYFTMDKLTVDAIKE